MNLYRLILLPATFVVTSVGAATPSVQLHKACRASLDETFSGWVIATSERLAPVEGDFDADGKQDVALLITFPRFDSARLPNVHTATQVVACLSSHNGKAVPVGHPDEVNITSGYLDPIHRSDEITPQGKQRPTDGLGFPQMSYWFENNVFVGDSGITDEDNE